MANNPIPIILILFLLKNKGGFRLPVIDTLQLESFLDNTKKLLDTMDKINNFSPDQLVQQLPDIEKIMALAGPVLSSMNSSSNDESR